MATQRTVNASTAGSSPASPASDLDCQGVINALTDYNWAKIREKMLIEGLSFEEASAQRMDEILAESEVFK